MIIRITINDNDFSNELTSFATNLVNKTLKHFEQMQDYEGWQKFFNIINPNVTENPTKEQKEFVADAVSKTIKEFCGQTDVGEYVRDNLKVSVVETYKDKWENGEVLYYFTRPNIILEN